MKKIALLLWASTFGISYATEHSPYAGEDLRSITALSQDEVESLRSGSGMGFARVAELNGYPGPKHVLELADDLGLTSAQQSDSEALFTEMQLNAVALGEALLAAEMKLERDFEQGVINFESLESALAETGAIRAQLRYVHLEAHLRQKLLLTEEQIAMYNNFRGYQSAAHDHVGHAESHD